MVVLWERPGSACSGSSACAAGLLGIKVELGDITEWWQKVKKGFELIKETVYGPLNQDLRENATVCKVTGYAVATATYFAPESQLGKALGLVIGFGTTYSC
jgi:hypothetical protein